MERDAVRYEVFGSVAVVTAPTNNRAAAFLKSLANYGGTGAAAGNLTMSADIENDRNVALFNTTSVLNLSSITRLDAEVETPPAQASGGGLNTTMSAGTITLATPLANGASINLRFLLGVQVGGNFRFFINVEALP